MQRETLEQILLKPICKDIVSYFLDILEKTPLSNRGKTPKLGLASDTRSPKKCLYKLYFPESLHGEKEAEKDILECVKFNLIHISFKDKKESFPLYKRKAMITFNTDMEQLCRQILKKEIYNYKEDWQKSIMCSTLNEDIKNKLLMMKPIVFKGKTFQNIIERITAYLQLNRENDFVRASSAYIFWGHSKILDNKLEWQELLKVRQSPIQILLYIHNIAIRNILFIENKQTFESLQLNKDVIENYILIFLSGFTVTASRLSLSMNRSFYPKGNIDRNETTNTKLNSIFDSQDDYNYYFWGDLDFEGINIYISLKKTFKSVSLWMKGYKLMVQMLIRSDGHKAINAKKEKQHQPLQVRDYYIDDILIPLMVEKGFYDQEGILI